MDSVKVAGQLREIKILSQHVKQEYEEQQAAFEAEHEAEAKLLDAVLSGVKPALPAISNRMKNCTWNGTGVLVYEYKDPQDEPVRLYVDSEGDLVEISKQAVWIDGPPGFSDVEWNSAVVQTEYVIERYDVGTIVAALHAALTKQVGKRQAKTAESRESAAKINAILTLLDIPPAANEPSTDAAAGDDIPF